MIPDSVLQGQPVQHPAPGALLAFAERAAPMSHFSSSQYPRSLANPA